MITIKKEDNGIEGRFVICEDDVFAGEMTYLWADDNEILVEHTGVEDVFRGKEMAKMLFDAMIEFVKEQNLKVIPICSYVAKMMKKDDSLLTFIINENSL